MSLQFFSEKVEYFHTFAFTKEGNNFQMNEHLLIEKPVVLLLFSHHFGDDLYFDDGVIAQYLLDKHETQVPCPELT